MEDFEALPDARLAANVLHFFDYRRPVESAHVAVGNLLVFAMPGSELELDGRRRADAALFCICNDPAVLPYAKGPGSVVGARLTYGAFHRMFGLDASRNRGIVAVDRDRHPAMAAIGDRLADADSDPRGRFVALTDALLPLAEAAQPPGFAERFMALVRESGGNIAIAEAADRLGGSARTLERDCQRRFGRTPKQLARGWRAARTLNLEQKRGERPETMAEFAFADLSHYARELRRISGLSRSEHRAGAQAAGEIEERTIRLWPDGRRAGDADDLGRWRADLEFRLAGA